jgi:hypothetical protein
LINYPNYHPPTHSGQREGIYTTSGTPASTPDNISDKTSAYYPISFYQLPYTHNMRQWVLLMVACVVMAYQFQMGEAQFSFSLPGKWGNGKRNAGWPRKAGDCGEVDPDAIFSIYKAMQNEAWRINECMQAKEDMKKNQMP